MSDAKPQTKKRIAAKDKAWITSDLRSLAVPIEQVAPSEKNPKEHDHRSIAAICASLREYGQRKPIVVNRSDGQVIAGNGTLQAALTLGQRAIAVVWVEDDPQTASGYAISDNRSAEFSRWDQEMLGELLGGVDLSETCTPRWIWPASCKTAARMMRGRHPTNRRVTPSRRQAPRQPARPTRPRSSTRCSTRSSSSAAMRRSRRSYSTGSKRRE